MKLITYAYVVGKMKMSSWHTGGRTLKDDVRLAQLAELSQVNCTVQSCVDSSRRSRSTVEINSKFPYVEKRKRKDACE